jgi:hypothetical protein
VSSEPNAISWGRFDSSPMIVVNATDSTRDYLGHIASKAKADTSKLAKLIETAIISLPANSICYVDRKTISNLDPETVVWMPFARYVWYAVQTIGGGYFEDVTNPDDPIYNAIYLTGNSNISTCAANDKWCASGKWGSMSVGLANIGNTDLIHDAGSPDNLLVGQVKVLPDNRWDSGSTIYWRSDWNGKLSTALLMIQGSIDGSGFDVAKAAPTVEQIKSAKPCSDYIKK